jgi:hypothetical protein
VSIAQFDERSPKITGAQFLLADGTNPQSLGGPGTTHSRVDDILAANSDGIDHVLGLEYVIGAITLRIGSVNIPAGSGYAGAPAVSLGTTLLPSLQLGWLLAGSISAFQATLEVAVVTGSVDVVAFGGDF